MVLAISSLLPQPAVECVHELKMKCVSWEKPGRGQHDKDTNRVWRLAESHLCLTFRTAWTANGPLSSSHMETKGLDLSIPAATSIYDPSGLCLAVSLWKSHCEAWAVTHSEALYSNRKVSKIEASHQPPPDILCGKLCLVVSGKAACFMDGALWEGCLVTNSLLWPLWSIPLS